MIICWLCQRTVSSHVDTNTPLPEWAHNHVHDCAACRETYVSATALARHLSATGNDQRKPAPPFLHGKIMSAVRSRRLAAPRSGRRRLAWAMAAGAAFLVTASIVWLRPSSARFQDAAKATSLPSELALNVALPSAAQVDQWTKSLDAPLEQETKLVLLDATAAINTLARNFLPEDLLASAMETARH
jgi:predicted anti-sigma-YlaC factor YlaD